MLLKLTMLAAVALFATAAHAQRTQTFYDSRGNVAGTVRTAGTATTFIDKRGRYVGSFTRGGVRPLPPQQARPLPLKRPFAAR